MNRSRFAGLRRSWTVYATDLAYQVRRPAFLIWALMLIWISFGLSQGKVRIMSGDATVGGTKSHITSEFAVAMFVSIFAVMFHGFFVSVAAGMAIIQDEDWRVGELLPRHAASAA